MTNYVKTALNNELDVQSLISVHYFEYAKDFKYSGEFHDFWELVYTDKETLMITAGAHELTLKAGQLYIHRPMEFHSLRCDGERAANSVIVSFAADCPQLYSIAGKVITCPQSWKKYIAKLLAEAKNAFCTPLGERRVLELIRNETQPFGAEQLLKIHLEELLILLIREFGENGEKNPVKNDEDPNARLAKICQYIQSQVEHGLSFSALCRHFSTSESTMKKLFRDGIGSGAIDYYNRCKIDRAKQLIREKEKNFTEIAERLGYHSVQYFSRHFKQSTGMTPSQYAESIENML